MTGAWSRWRGIPLAGLLVALACAPRAQPQAPTADPCLVRAADADVAGSITVGVAHRLIPDHAPAPTNPADAILLPFLYETLVRVDCQGAVRPALAVEWSGADGGRLWTLRLDPEARFWDGSRVTAADAAASLLGSLERAAGSGERFGIAGLGVLDEGTLSIRFERPHGGEVPAVLADPALAIAGRRVATWPAGTGTHRIATHDGSRSLTVRPVDGSGPTLVVRTAPGADGRDLLDEGAELLVTRDAAVVEYVELRAQLDHVPLPWDRAYALLSPTRVRALRRGELDAPSASRLDGLRARLARDAVEGAARPHAAPGWWSRSERCRADAADASPRPPPPGAFGSSSRVVYPQGDDAARQLAERIVALGAIVGSQTRDEAAVALAAEVPDLDRYGDRLLATGLSESELEQALVRGSAFLYVVGLPLRPLDVCVAFHRLDRRVPWLDVGQLDPARSIVPLIDTRPHLVTASGLPAIYMDGSGALRLEPSLPKRPAGGER